MEQFICPMKNRNINLRSFSAVVFLIGASFFLNGCTKSGSYPSYTPPATPQGAYEVWIQNIAFNPIGLTVPVNTIVKWTNKDGITHTVTSATALFDSGNIGSGGTFSYQFTSKGTFAYKCKIHTGMNATVIVQ
jgi:plastocyanin